MPLHFLLSAARWRHTSAAGNLQVINTHLLKHLQGVREILSFLLVTFFIETEKNSISNF